MYGFSAASLRTVSDAIKQTTQDARRELSRLAEREMQRDEDLARNNNETEIGRAQRDLRSALSKG